MHEIYIPGSKSYSNRAILLTTLGAKKIVLNNVCQGNDTIWLVKALMQLGVGLSLSGKSLEVEGTSGNFKPFYGELNTGISGTASRFLACLCALVPGEFVLTAEGRMLERPMKDLFDGLAGLGINFQYLGNEGCLPVRFKNTEFTLADLKTTPELEISGSKSSQFLSALLLVGTSLPQGLVIRIKDYLVSKSYVEATAEVIEWFGLEADIDFEANIFKVKSGNSKLSQFNVPGDLTGATYFWGLAAITGKTIRCHNTNRKWAQGDAKFPFILDQMGCEVEYSDELNWIQVTGSQSLAGLEVNMEDLPDSAQTLAVVAAFAKGVTLITGLSTLKLKETDRIEATATELRKMGIEIETGVDWLKVYGGVPKVAAIKTYDDHRMAMSFGIAKSKVPGLKILNPEVVSKSYTNFWEELEAAYAYIENNSYS